jgi:hypothetical protein
VSRLRTIKPGFFLNDELAECSPLARLLFAGLWTIADREGRLEDRPRRIKAAVLPYDDCDVDELLDALDTKGFIVRYEVDRERYIVIPTWHDHQKPDARERASTIPALPEHRQDADKTRQDTDKTPTEQDGDTDESALSLGSCLLSLGSGVLSSEPPHIPPAEAEGSRGSRASGTNPRALGTNPRCTGESPRQQGTNPRASAVDGESEGEVCEGEIVSDPFDEFWEAWPNRKGAKRLTRERFRKLTPTEQQQAIDGARHVAAALDSELLELTYQPRAENFVGGSKRYFEEWHGGIPAHLSAKPRAPSAFGALGAVAQGIYEEEVGSEQY